jgi:hypothetical protein
MTSQKIILELIKHLDYRITWINKIFLDYRKLKNIRLKMESSNYTMKDFTEIQSTHKSASINRMSAGNCDDFSSYTFNSSDDSFNSNSSSDSKSSEKKNDSLKNFDLLLNDCDSKTSDNNLNEIDIHNKREHHKSFLSIIKFFKNSTKSKTTNELHQSILRRPTEYIHVRGISGLPIRVIKASSSSSSAACCHRIVKR